MLRTTALDGDALAQRSRTATSARFRRSSVIPKVAILGANGFIGSRTAEMLHLSQLVEVRPIVRNFASLARLARFDLENDLDCRVADGFDGSKLSEAMIGCDALIYAIAGDRRTILQTLKPV